MTPQERATMDEAAIALANLTSYQSPGKTPPANEFSHAIKALTSLRAALDEPTSKDYAMGYAEGFNDGCAPKEQAVQPGSLNAIDDLAKVYCSNYASPHNIITFSASGLRKMIKAAQPLPPTEPDNLTIAYMSGFADGKKAAQPVQQGEQKTQSFGEKYPRNPDAKCKCEHWEACTDCHPTYVNAAIKGGV